MSRNFLTVIKQSAIGQIWTPYYKEWVYWMHTPASTTFKYAFFFLWSCAIGKVMLWHNERFGNTYRRKRMRFMELEKNHTPEETREGWALKQEYGRLIWPG